MRTTTYSLDLDVAKQAKERVKNIVTHTPLVQNMRSSDRFSANISLKREDLQVVRSYKIRGAFNKISQLTNKERSAGVVCASAGNHAQGVAYSCQRLGVNATIFMPSPTPKQKVEQVKFFGKERVDVVLIGDTFDDAYQLALEFSENNSSPFIHPFDDEKVIEGQATVALEILEDCKDPIDYLFLPIGGGGLAAGVASVFRDLSPQTKIIGVEPQGAAAMQNSIELGHNVRLDHIDKFVDGAAVQKVGDKTFEICRQLLTKVITVPEGQICATMLDLYNRDAIVLEPAGALSIAGLEEFSEDIVGKNVVCILSGSNNDISRTEEVRERALLHAGLKHFYIVGFPQRAGALKEFLVEVLGPNDDIVHFEYTKKTSREKGPAVIGIEHQSKEDFEPFIQRMRDMNFNFEYLNENSDLFSYII